MTGRIRNAKRTWHNGRVNREVDRHAGIEVIEGRPGSLAPVMCQWERVPTPPSLAPEKRADG